MSRPIMEKPQELVDLGRLAPTLFTALRDQYGVRHPHPVDLSEPDRPLAELTSDGELAAVGMRYAQLLRQYGQEGVRVRSEELITLLNSLDHVLQRLLGDTDHEPRSTLSTLRQAHEQLATMSFNIATRCGTQLSYLE